MSAETKTTVRLVQGIEAGSPDRTDGSRLKQRSEIKRVAFIVFYKMLQKGYINCVAFIDQTRGIHCVL